MFECEGTAAFCLGMTPHDYWEEDPELFWWYANRYKQQQDKEAQERDTLAWLTGQYVMSGVAVIFADAFGKRGAPKPKYPEMPMYVAEHNEQAKAKKQERDMMRSYNNFIAAAQLMGKLEKVEPR